MLDGEGGDCTLNGLYLAGGHGSWSTTTRPSTTPSPTARAASSTRASSTDTRARVFNGRIIVRPDAQKTDAKQTNKTLLLSDDAQINTKPQLEIFADDVKCTHGATVGQLDEDAIFYLRRAGPRPAARPASMLVHAFARGHRSAALTLRRRFGQLAGDGDLPRRAGGERGPGLTGRNRMPHDVITPRRPRPLRRAQHPRGFPHPAEPVHGKPLVYLDNAATTQKPQAVIDALVRLLHAGERQHPPRRAPAQRARDRGLRGRRATRSARFLNAADAREIVFVRGTTEAINLVAQTYGRAHVGPGDEIVISAMEHHSNIVPWQMLCEQTGARLRVVPIDRRRRAAPGRHSTRC